MKYKLLNLMLLLCLVYALPQTASAVDNSPTFKLALNNSSPGSGDRIQVTLSGQGLNDVFAYEASLEFDTSHLTYDSWTASEKGYSAAPIVKGNQLLFVYTKIGNVQGSYGNLDMGTITFKTKGNGPADITLKSIKLVDSKLASFTVETSDVQVSVKSFIDVPSSHWAWASIEELTAKHIINGTSADTFEPDRSVTRAEFTAMLVRGLNLTQAGSQMFADVASGDWYAQPISIAVKAGIVTGKTADSFAPNAQITREEMVTMVMRAYAISNGAAAVTSKASSFSDEADVNSWALPYVREAASLQLINGREDGKFEPTGTSTRAEAATILMRILP